MKPNEIFKDNNSPLIYKAWLFSRDHKASNDIESLKVDIDGDTFAFDIKSAITHTIIEKFNAETWPDTNVMINDIKNGIVTILTIELEKDDSDEENLNYITNVDFSNQTAKIAVKGKIKNCNCTNFNVVDIVLDIADDGFTINDIALEPIVLNQANN